MTTAHRATFAPAKAGASRGESDLGKLSKQYSSRDLPSHKTLKYRQPGQNAPEDIRGRDLRHELAEREHSSRSDKRSDSRSSRDSKRQRLDHVPASNLDADDAARSDSDSDSDDSEDDTAELMAELNRIKKERAEETAKLEEEKREEAERIRTENILSGNPLLTDAKANSNFSVKRRWDDDVVFKNCARGESDKTKQNFINDTLRSEFHKKFMDKYVK
uniref:Spliceosome-associated protein CWC15 homolog n=1 Tax=Ciona intestinalis TaxID=7719 RepID=F6ZQ39_CIOIN|nr:spliceosome-associated protein CWC15 homolog [Ciona intestinalis]|eukprot:XP_002128129.1 spliceosome-associated protein CWC15 homolog [Ciona intestinalis]